MANADTKYMVLDISVFHPDEKDSAHNRHIGKFIDDATREFKVFLVTPGDDIHDASENVYSAEVLKYCHTNDVVFCTWEDIRGGSAHVFISDRVSCTDHVKSQNIFNSMHVAWSHDSFAWFMNTYGHELETDPNICPWQESKEPKTPTPKVNEFAHLQSIYDDVQAVWDKARATPAVKALLREFNKSAHGSMPLRKALFCYFATVARDMPNNGPEIAEDYKNLQGLIDEKAPKGLCKDLLTDALSAIHNIVGEEPRNELYFAA